MKKELGAKNNIVADIEYHSGNADIFIFGKSKNWKDDIHNLPELLNILHNKKIKTLYLPEISGFTGVLGEPSDFYHEIDIGGIKIMNGCKVEGLTIPKDSAAFFPTADCHVIVYHDIRNDLLIAAHAGLGSLIDKQKIITNVPSRSNESIIDIIMRYAKDADIKKNSEGEDADHYEIFVVAGIGCKSFKYDINDPVYGETNRKIFSNLFEFYGTDAVPQGSGKGNISISGIIQLQLESFGVDPLKIKFDGIDTYTDERFWSHRRAISLGEKGCERNGILVIHK